jgi:hypothetical protein
VKKTQPASKKEVTPPIGQEDKHALAGQQCAQAAKTQRQRQNEAICQPKGKQR